MKILSLTHADPLNAASGSALRVWNMTHRLAERHELRLLTSATPSTDRDVPAWLEVLPPTNNGRRLWRHFKALTHGIPPSVQAHRSAALAARVHQLVQEGWPEVAIAEEGSAAIELELLPKTIPKVLVKHSVHQREVEERARRMPGLAVRLEELSARRYEKRGLRRADAVVTLSEEDRRELKVRYGSFDGVVVPNGCPQPDIAWSDPQAPRVAILADYRWQPNRWELAWFLERVWPQLDVQGAQLDVIGPQPDTPPSSDRVRFLGRVDDLFAALRACSVLALPVRYGSGIRTRLLDGLALGMPIVTTSLGIRGIAARDAVEVADSTADFAERIAKLLDDGEARQKRHRAALAVAQTMTWEDAVRRFEALLERLVRQ